jgi:hypothetical protein
MLQCSRSFCIIAAGLIEPSPQVNTTTLIQHYIFERYVLVPPQIQVLLDDRIVVERAIASTNGRNLSVLSIVAR